MIQALRAAVVLKYEIFTYKGLNLHAQAGFQIIGTLIFNFMALHTIWQVDLDLLFDFFSNLLVISGCQFNIYMFQDDLR